MRNYQILRGLFNEQAIPVNNWQLMDEGFEFKFITGVFRVDQGYDINLCYEYGWHQLPDNKVRIFKLDPLWITGLAKVIK